MYCRGHHMWVWTLVVVLCGWFCVHAQLQTSGKMDACRIFCNGQILKHVQLARLFNDSKHFVDMKLKESPEIIEKRFQNLLNQTKDKPQKKQLQDFVSDNFGKPGKEFEDWIPHDWKPDPKFIDDIYDLSLRNWAKDINKRWESLGRKMTDDVKQNGQLYSQLYVPNPFIIPGGRFTEIYYWDSYFILEGLLLSEMYDTAKGMIENLVYLVEQYGYVPNGSRKYYLGRSQPPLLIPMVDLYYRTTKDKQFLNKTLGSLEKEFSFWQNNRSVSLQVDGTFYTLYQFKVLTKDPRPESYYEDIELVKNITDQAERERIFSEIKSAAESGWDFSSRWFLENGQHSDKYKDIHTTSIAPVCLNSIMGLNARLLSQLNSALGNTVKGKKFENLAHESNLTLSRIFWSERDGVWLDYNIVKKELIAGFYPSNLIPLWAETFGEERAPDYIIEQAVAYLDRYEIDQYVGGIPASLISSGQQWDMPNNWAPLQYFLVMGLHKAGDLNNRAQELAFIFARDWVRNVYLTYMNTTPHAIFEKYNATQVGRIGEGGEYETQTGFGWTNAVVMKFLSIYGHKIRIQESYDPAPLAVGLLLMDDDGAKKQKNDRKKQK